MKWLEAREPNPSKEQEEYCAVVRDIFHLVLLIVLKLCRIGQVRKRVAVFLNRWDASLGGRLNGTREISKLIQPHKCRLYTKTLLHSKHMLVINAADSRISGALCCKPEGRGFDSR
jgi:hypothetical protein